MAEPFYSFNTFLRDRFFNQKVLKIPINAGFACPNKNGKISNSGCIFCDQFGSGPIKTFDLSIEEQIESFMKKKPGLKYIAYYQANSNTYGPVGELRQKYEIVFNYKDIVGLFIGTRPDTIGNEVVLLLEKISKKIFLTVELGLQSIHKKSLDFLQRNHSYDQFLSAFSQLKKSNIDVVVHLIVGIPGETRAQILDTVAEMNRLKPAGIKFHLLHILKNTPLQQPYLQKKVPLLKEDEYVDLMIEILEKLDPAIVIHRLTGERDKQIFLAPEWALNKIKVINAIKKGMQDKNTWQGKKLVKAL